MSLEFLKIKWLRQLFPRGLLLDLSEKEIYRSIVLHPHIKSRTVVIIIVIAITITGSLIIMHHQKNACRIIFTCYIHHCKIYITNALFVVLVT
jgi:hypothetical protein